MKIRAPAKINLSLRVVGRRADGYHLLDTIMVPVSLYDDVKIRTLRGVADKKTNGGPLVKVRCDHPLVPDGKRNLVYRAARLILAKAKSRHAIEIFIRKRIPVGAGLGGGSTDAAATLVGLNRLLKLGFSAKQLEHLGLTLGADVPFFIRGRPARARGIGERLRPLGPIARRWLVILYPGFPVSTAWVYRNLLAKLTKPSVNTSIASLLTGDGNLAATLVNDLESVTLGRYPKIGLLKRKLLAAGATGSLMSGSGSSVFGVFDSKRKAEEAFRGLRQEEESQAFLVHVLNQRFIEKA
ncbi:MAG: 4-(cytidine 5'-diphospho)-2-C-methyl-D-erythritol kinase [Candidatus Binatia bacterium]